MPAVDFTVNDEQVTASLTELAAKISEPEVLLREASAILAANERAVFDSEGSSIEADWPPLSENTVIAKGDSRMLVMTGRLRAAMSDPENVHIIGGTAVLSSSSVPYAHFHVTGTSRMPARPFMGISPETNRALMELVKRYIDL